MTPKPMTDAELLKHVDEQIERAEDYIDNKIDPERAVAYDLYYGRLFGDEVEGRSQVISRDVCVAIDSSVPQLVKMFAGGDRVVECAPRGPEDVHDAELATDAANYIFWNENNGYLILHDGIKDGLLAKTGIYKWRWEEREEQVEETFMGLDDVMLAQVAEQGEVVAYSAVPMAMGMMHNITVKMTKKTGKVCIDVIPPEDFLIAPDASGPLCDKASFVCHKPLLSIEELIGMGYSEADLHDAVNGDDDSGLNTDLRTSRWTRTNSGALSEERAEAKKKVRYYECYLDVDADGDGKVERLMVCKVGSKILRQQVVDHTPMAMWTPKSMPHEPIGISLADDTGDMQILSTVLWRQTLDNLYISNSPRLMVVDGQANLDDVLQPRIGGVIRMRQPGAVEPLAIPFTAAQSFQMLEYVKQEIEQRTGISRYYQGMDPNTLNKTATGVTALMNAASVRMEMYARNFAETALKPLMRGILYLLSKNKQDALVARITGQPVQINPEVWGKEYDWNINVGLGTGTKDQQMAHLSNIVGLQMQVAQSPYAQLVPPKTVWNAAAKLVNNAGFKDPEQFFKDPSKPPEVDPQTGQPTEAPWPPPPGPPPEIQKAQMQIQADQQKFQAQAQMDQQKMGMEQANAEKQMLMEAELEKFKAQLKAETELAVERIKAAHDMERHQAEIANAHSIARLPYDADLEKQRIAVGVPAIQAHLDRAGQLLEAVLAAQGSVIEEIKRPKVRRAVRGPDGRISHAVEESAA